ncbi:hypothetical protein AZG88_19840 [Rhodococcus sp. LB1]|nr:putative membrane protein [Rhodococcus opacus PD630]KXX55231.1 hypothetical protein AZG88_19840 [Rhodococcus sp. LB1]PBC55342.1 hypothetical protein CJ177_20470 [Rhodococcus sp. ACPA1]RZK83595.1 MAG: hypothetical protein EOP26_11875 [Rhodococcus sp. (in: high G+C Gram-positive bacteria)]
MRGCDRLRSAMVLIGVFFVLLMVPLAAAVGTETYSRLDQQTQAELATHHPTPAKLVEDSRTGTTGEPLPAAPQYQAHARVQWSANGQTHTADVPTESGAKAGQTVTVWLDPNGGLVAAPETGSQNAATAVSVACGIWVTAAGGYCLLFLVVHWVASRRQQAQLTREWNELDRPPGWHVS